MDVAGSQKLKSFSKGMTVKYSCRAACSVEATLTIAAKTARQLHVSRTLATATAQLARPAHTALKLKPAAKTATRLKKAKRVRAVVDVELSNATVSESYSAEVTIRR